MSLFLYKIRHHYATLDAGMYYIKITITSLLWYAEQVNE